jgi:hypothetical protein
MRVKYLIACASLSFAGLASAQATSPDGGAEASQAATVQADPAGAAASTAANATVGATAGTSETATAASQVRATPAGDADLARGAAVNDPAGKLVGTVDSTLGDNVVLSLGKQKVQIPKASIGKTDSGLMVTVTRQQLEAAIAKKAS